MDGRKLHQIITHVERLLNERLMINESIKDALKDAELNKFSSKIIKMIIKRRQMDKIVLEEEEHLLEQYESCLNNN